MNRRRESVLAVDDRPLGVKPECAPLRGRSGGRVTYPVVSQGVATFAGTSPT
jgi:hypothetical protein